MKKRILVMACVSVMMAMTTLVGFGSDSVSAASSLGDTSCPDLKIIFARGSGGTRWEDQNYLTFKSTLEEKLKLIDISYEFEDLDYPAVDIGSVQKLVSAYVGRGDAYEFGDSVNLGVKNLVAEINSSTCTGTKYVIGGYSQGAMVISKSAPSLDASKMIYAATFGDPKIYLPEGAGFSPAACKGLNLSNYRIYVPDCRTYKGVLGAYQPYQPEGLIDKMGTWCNKADFFCSSHLNILDHLAYVSDDIYADASKVIFDKITKAFGIKNEYVSTHDTAILIDSTGSMSGLIGKYKQKAIELAERTLESGGRVALYDYRDVNDRYEPVQRCSFETCTLESFKEGLAAIETDGGGDTPESLLSASLRVMKELKWRYGATKSLVVLTDAGYHSPDIDGVTFENVVALSKKIDPVNFYIVTETVTASQYVSLATATDGAVMTVEKAALKLNDTIMERYDSLPRVEELFAAEIGLLEAMPVISDVSVQWLSDTEAKISWKNSGARTLVALDDYLLGATDETSIVLTDLNRSEENVVTLAPMGVNVRGESVTVDLDGGGSGSVEMVTIPKAPNTGKK